MDTYRGISNKVSNKKTCIMSIFIDLGETRINCVW